VDLRKLGACTGEFCTTGVLTSGALDVGCELTTSLEIAGGLFTVKSPFVSDALTCISPGSSVHSGDSTSLTNVP
jgi:hypothetical protein